MVRRVLRPWSAAAVLEIMAGALEESKCCSIAWRWTDQGAAGQQQGGPAGERGGGMPTPSQGLTLRLTGVPKARPS